MTGRLCGQSRTGRAGPGRGALMIVAGVLSMVLLASCTAGSVPDSSSASPEASVSAAGDRVVTDMAGRRVTVPARVESVGTFGSIGVLNAFVQAMGAGDRIVNQMSANFTKSDQWRMQYEFSPQIRNGPLFEEGGEVVIETVLANKPDVSFTMTKDTAELLESKGVPVIYLEWNDPTDVRQAVELVGETLGTQDRAAQYIDYFDAKMAESSELIADLPDEQRLSVLYGDPVSFRQPHVIAEWWIEQAGGRSVTNDGRTDNSTFEYTMEDLLAWNPQVMVVTNEKLVDEMRSNPTYDTIAAVSTGDIHVIPTVAHVWGNRTVEQPLTVLWTMHQLYPDRVSRERLSDEIRSFYSTFFDYQMSDEQLAAIIDR